MSVSYPEGPETHPDRPETASEARTIDLRVPPEQAGARLDRLLAETLPDLSRSRLKALIEAGCLSGSLGGSAATIAEPSHRVKAGQNLRLTIPATVPAQPRGQAIALDVVFEDEALIVIDKPAGLVVHPAAGNPDGTLVNALIAHCGESLLGIGGERRPGIVHRLDKDTSGLLVAAKSERVHAELVRQFAAREIARSYRAVAWGVPAPAAGELSGNIGRSPHNRKKMAVLPRGGRSALTRYRTLQVLAGGVASLLECRLETGRTHQIRVHMAEAGHPLIGDPVYGRTRNKTLTRLSGKARGEVEAFTRQALHAVSLGFRHPVSGATLFFETPLPKDMTALIAALEAEKAG